MSLVDTYHAYIFGTSFWYATRGLARLTDPVRVSGWFRPPSQPVSKPSAAGLNVDLELYNIWTDGWQLITLAAMLLIFTNAIPLPGSQADSSAIKARKPYAKMAIMATVFHHVTTAWGAYGHWSRDSHYTPAMGIGVWVNVFLTVAGVVALYFGFGEGESAGAKVAGKKRA